MAKSILPEVEVYARPFGYLQWLCPNCHEIHGAEQVSGRTGRIRCGECKRVYRIGFIFSDYATNQLLPPWNAQEACDPWNGYTVHRREFQIGRTSVARFRGRLDWSCPECHKVQSSTPDRVMSGIQCYTCNSAFYLSVLFHSAKSGVTVKTPLDYSIPYEIATDALDAVAAAETN